MRYLLLEVNEGGFESALESGKGGFLFKFGPLSEEESCVEPFRIHQIRKFVLSVEALNTKLGFGFHPNTEPLGVIISSVEGFVGEAIPLHEIAETVKRDFPKMEWYFRGTQLPIC